MTQNKNLSVAYFTMEIGLKKEMPTFAGGLGMLAGDLMRSCRDMKVNAACVTIGWKHGYLKQKIHPDGNQSYEDISWKKEDYLTRLPETIEVEIEDRKVKVAAWQYDLKKVIENKNTADINDLNKAASALEELGLDINALKSNLQASLNQISEEKPSPAVHNIPIIFLDTDIEENSPEDREITNHLYGGDGAMRLKQEVVLGIGGVRMLRALGYHEVNKFHMNEGHAAFLTLELLKERDFKDENVKPSCAFTTHTPVKAGHDAFDYNLAHQVVGDMLPWHIKKLAGEDALSMTDLAMHLSSYTCGVSEIHGIVSRKMFPGEQIDHITNGIHHTFWACPSMQELFDKYALGWRKDPLVLKKLSRIFPEDELWMAHMQAKKALIDKVNERDNANFDYNTLTIATARRVVPYKRPELIYTNLKRLKEIGAGKLQIIHAGNAHPSDKFSQEVIKRIIERSRELKDFVKITYLENYNPDLAKLMISGADVWLNMPKRLYEASGTSGMKACLNGVLNLSSLDGWWAEAYEYDSESGWRIGPLAQALDDEEHKKIDAEDLYTQLQFEVIPEYYYKDRRRWIKRMKRAISLIGYFNTNRCVRDYLEKAW